MSTDDALRDLIGSGKLAVLATIKRDGLPQLSNVTYVYDRGRDLIRVSITDHRAKTANMRRDPRAVLQVSSADGWSYAVAESRAELLPVCEKPDDPSVAELIDIYREAAGAEHPDWDDFRRAMVEERRVPLHLHVQRVYGSVH